MQKDISTENPKAQSIYKRKGKVNDRSDQVRLVNKL